MAAKKKKSKSTKAKKAKPTQPEIDVSKLPKDAQKRVEEIKGKITKFQEGIVAKFDKYIVGVALLPPPKEPKKEEKDNINVLVLVDDSDSMKMSKEELKQKLTQIIESMAKEIDKNIVPQTVILSELWQSCYDNKHDVLQMIAMSAPFYDTGIIAAIKISEVHKSLVLKKFEKYIVSYVLAGSLTQGKATPTSDIDVWIVIDDTDVKRMTRVELKDKLRAIIIGMGIEAGDITGIRNKLNIQVYILTDFWDSLKEANPVIFTLLRDGVPLYDRGTFMPWKQLLKMGKIKPSPEAIELFMSSGDQMLKRVHMKIKEIGMEDTFWAILTPSQAALMMYGIPPPTPRETPELIRELFVKKEGILEEKYVKILENNINVRKELEHGSGKQLTGKEVDKLLKDSEDYLARIKKLFEQIDKMKQENDIVNIYDTMLTVIRDVLRMEGRDKVLDAEIIKAFEDEMIATGKVPARYLRILNEVMDAKKHYDDKATSKVDIESVKKNSREFIKFIVEYMQRKRGREIERAKVRIKYADRYGELLLLGNEVFVIHDIDAEEKHISKAKIDSKGEIGALKDSSYEEFEKALAKVEIPEKVFIKEKTFEHIKRIFGADVEILVNY